MKILFGDARPTLLYIESGIPISVKNNSPVTSGNKPDLGRARVNVKSGLIKFLKVLPVVAFTPLGTSHEILIPYC
jgi:hypothetical protein